MLKRLGGIIGCKDKTSSWHLKGFSDGSIIGSTVQYREEAHRQTVVVVVDSLIQRLVLAAEQNTVTQ